ncbi:hypothetical protein JD969_06100 [Planctomycetota bacterium]|nr:hypothetical protein JD969_06100 [Planctomycetota bacterium]
MKRIPTNWFIYITFLLALLTTAQAADTATPITAAAPNPDQPKTSPYIAAENHLAAVHASLKYLDEQLPTIAVAAEETALRLAGNPKASIHIIAPSTSATRPSPYYNEFTNRPGALLASRTKNPTHNNAPKSDDVTLLFLTPDTPTYRMPESNDDFALDQQTVIKLQLQADLSRLIKQAQTHKAKGSFLISFIPLNLIKELNIDLETIPHDLLIDISPDPQTPSPLPTYNTAIPAGWTYYSELFCASTRHFRDNIPVVRKSFELDTRQLRYVDYIHTPYHADRLPPDPVKPMALGAKYLKTLQNITRDLQTASFDNIEHTIDRMSIATAEDSRIFINASGPFIQYLSPIYSLNSTITSLPNYPSIYTPWRNQTPKKSDFIIIIADHQTAYSEYFGSYKEIDRIKQFPLGSAWIIESYNTPKGTLRRANHNFTDFPHDTLGDILIDKFGQVGDTLINVPDYDTNLGPSSTFTSLTLYQTLTAPFLNND